MVYHVTLMLMTQNLLHRCESYNNVVNHIKDCTLLEVRQWMDANFFMFLKFNNGENGSSSVRVETTV